MKSTYAAIFSTDSIPNVKRSLGKAALAICCLKGKAEVMVIWPEYVGLNTAPVKWRIDEQAIMSERWKVDRYNLWANNPIAMARSLLGKNELVLNVEAYGKIAASLTFRLRGIDEAITPSRELCKWQ